MEYTVNWDRQSTSSGYSVTHCPDHPKAWSTGYVYTHRLVVEAKLGRLLHGDETIHHRDGNKLNNEANNLQVVTRSQHSLIHAEPQWANLTCDNCGDPFKRKHNQLASKKGYVNTFCSRRCNGIFQRRKQREGR